MSNISMKEFFSGKNVFITGATGFLGKVLIEKLLRFCPNIGTVYLLIRKKREKTILERMQQMLENPLFDKIKNENKDALKKLKPLEGDTTAINLGISEDDKNELFENVHIIYHTAASIKFDDPLQYSVFVNVRSTKTLIEMAYMMKNLVLFVHVSTAYCNYNETIVEEKLYPSHGDWREAIQLCESCDERIINIVTQKYIQPFPNTYLFTKLLAEHVVFDLCDGKIPAIIIRPSIVTNILFDPLPGWIDNLNGPIGISIGGSKGVVKIYLGDSNTKFDLIPADTVIAIFMQTTYHHGVTNRKCEVQIYHASNNLKPDYNLGEMINDGLKNSRKMPSQKMLWYPRFNLTNCFYNYYFQVLLFHFLPSMLIDMLLRIFGKQPMLLRIQRKIYVANSVLVPFMRKTWYFKNTNVLDVEKRIPKEFRKEFCSFEYLQSFSKQKMAQVQSEMGIGVYKYIFKERSGKEFLPLLNRMWMLDISTKLILISVVLWYLFF